MRLVSKAFAEALRSIVMFAIFIAVPVAVSIPAVALCGSFGNMWEGWTIIDDDDAIRIYQREASESSVLIGGAEAVLGGSFAEVCTILLDVSLYVEWVDLMARAEIIRRYGPYDLIIYFVFDIPWPISDRDYVAQVVLDINERDRTLTAYELSVTHESKPDQDCCVRGRIMEATIVLKSIAANKTAIAATAQIDLAGMIPTWLANIFQEGFPRKTIEAYRRRLAAPGLRLIPECVNLFDSE